MSRKTRNDSVLGTLPDERQAEIADHCRSHSLTDTVAWLRSDGVRVGRTALSNWLSSWSLRQRFVRAESNAETFREWMAKESPSLSEEELDKRAALMFQFSAVEEGNAEQYLAFATARHKAKMDALKLDQKERGMAFDREKFLASIKTQIEHGLDALFAEVKSNPEARALFEQFKAVVRKAKA